MNLTHGKTRKNGQKVKKGMSLAHFSKIIKCGINSVCKNLLIWFKGFY